MTIKLHYRPNSSGKENPSFSAMKKILLAVYVLWEKSKKKNCSTKPNVKFVHMFELHRELVAYLLCNQPLKLQKSKHFSIIKT